MSNLSEKVAYLKGLVAGMNLSEDDNTHKLLLSMADVLEEFAHSYGELSDEVEELNDYIEEIDEDLQDLESIFYDEDDYFDDDSCGHCGLRLHHGGGDDGFDHPVHIECPHCGFYVLLDSCDFDSEEEPICPSCKKPLFPELDEDDFDDEFEDGFEDEEDDSEEND
jgi:hypothetical protein